ncbi:MAG TPA: cupin domain-containing protein [Candidatus Dormibacteraeota bacterium]|nr:cupin domain-containing protein [Candidatus Dormibacteraeota bacterium]
MAIANLVPIVRVDGEGEKLWFYGGGVHTWLATSSETGGAFLLFDDVMTRGKTTPLHSHPGVDETLYMLEGEILLSVAGREQTVGSGGFAMVPRGLPHAFLVTSERARILFLETPGSSEPFYRGASEPLTPILEATTPIDFDRVRASASLNGGIEILGPPPFDR